MGGRGTWWAVFCLMETQGTSILCDMYFSFLCSSALCLWLLERLSLWQEDGWTLSNNNNNFFLLFFSFIWDMLLKCYHGDIYNTLLSVSTNNQDKLYMLLLPLSFENIYIYIILYCIILYIYMYICMYEYMYLYMNIVYTCAYVYMCIYIYKYI